LYFLYDDYEQKMNETIWPIFTNGRIYLKKFEGYVKVFTSNRLKLNEILSMIITF
jgi:hypothetical protein